MITTGRNAPVGLSGAGVDMGALGESLASWPSSDKYPIVIGPGLSLAYISAIFRLSLNGYRSQYVDLLDEMLEKDPNAFSVLSKRVTSLCTGTIQLVPARKDDPISKEICDVCTEQIACIPDLMQHIAMLSWATYYAMVGLETHWARDGQTWFPERLSFIHSRRLAFPVSGSWDLYVWDSGDAVSDLSPRSALAKRSVRGIRIADAPGKFIIHSPQIRGNYPTREGLGRQLAYWMALKLVASRNAPKYLEQFTRPLPEGVYRTGNEGSGRQATDDDKLDAKAALSAMGAGSLTSWLHPDSIALNLRTPDPGSSPKMTFGEWISICNSEINKAVLGGTLSTEVGSTGGNRALGQEQGKGERKLLKFDAALMAETLRRDLVSWIVRLNFPKAKLSDVPRVKVHIEDDPDPIQIIERAAKAASAGAVVDGDAMCEQAGVKTIATGDLKGRRLVPMWQSRKPEAFDQDLAARAHAIVELYPVTPSPAVAQPDSGTTDTDDADTADDTQGDEPTNDAGDEPD